MKVMAIGLSFWFRLLSTRKLIENPSFGGFENIKVLNLKKVGLTISHCAFIV